MRPRVIKVWKAYKNAPKEFFYYIPVVTWENIEI